MTYYAAPHMSQYSYSTYTSRYGCTWTAGANGIAATTGGRNTPTPDYIHSLLPRDQETDPNSPGWSIPDLQKAISRYGMTLVNRTGKGWSDVVAQLLNGHYCVVQGVSAEFGDSTCSGEFDGTHCVGINPKHRTYNGERQWWTNDGICPLGRWEYERVLRRYAQALDPGIRYGAFISQVPQVAEPPAPTPAAGGNVTIKYAAVTSTASRMKLREGQRLYDSPGGKPVTSMSRTTTVAHVGLAGAVNGKAWRAVIVGTARVYKDNKVRRTVLYVPASAGTLS